MLWPSVNIPSARFLKTSKQALRGKSKRPAADGPLLGAYPPVAFHDFNQQSKHPPGCLSWNTHAAEFCRHHIFPDCFLLYPGNVWQRHDSGNHPKNCICQRKSFPLTEFLRYPAHSGIFSEQTWTMFILSAEKQEQGEPAMQAITETLFDTVYLTAVITPPGIHIFSEFWTLIFQGFSLSHFLKSPHLFIVLRQCEQIFCLIFVNYFPCTALDKFPQKWALRAFS